MRKKYFASLISHIYLLLLCFFAVFPLLWIIISSIKGKGELTGNPTAFLPKVITLEYYRHVIFDLGFIVNIRNSVIISLATTGIAITISALAAYGIVRFFPKIGTVLSKVLVTTYIFPSHPFSHSLFHRNGKAGTDQYQNRIGTGVPFLQYSLCGLAFGGIFQNSSHRNRRSRKDRWSQ